MTVVMREHTLETVLGQFCHAQRLHYGKQILAGPVQESIVAYDPFEFGEISVAGISVYAHMQIGVAVFFPLTRPLCLVAGAGIDEQIVDFGQAHLDRYFKFNPLYPVRARIVTNRCLDDKNDLAVGIACPDGSLLSMTENMGEGMPFFLGNKVLYLFFKGRKIPGIVEIVVQLPALREQFYVRKRLFKVLFQLVSRFLGSEQTFYFDFIALHGFDSIKYNHIAGRMIGDKRKILFLILSSHSITNMRCFIIAALSADGYIAKNDSHAAMWTSKEDKKRFVELTKKAGVVVMGNRTWKTLMKPLKDRVNIVYSSSGKVEGEAETTSLAPSELLKELKDRGFSEVAVCGGSQIYTMFMKAQVVDTLYLTIEPLVFGNGIKLFNEEFHDTLTLKNLEKTENGALLLEYKVNYGGPAN